MVGAPKQETKPTSWTRTDGRRSLLVYLDASLIKDVRLTLMVR